MKLMPTHPRLLELGMAADTSIIEKQPVKVVLGDEEFEYRGGKLWLYEHRKYFQRAMGEDVKPEVSK